MTEKWECLSEYREEHVAQRLGKVVYPEPEPSEIEKMRPENRPQYPGQT